MGSWRLSEEEVHRLDLLGQEGSINSWQHDSKMWRGGHNSYVRDVVNEPQTRTNGMISNQNDILQSKLKREASQSEGCVNVQALLHTGYFRTTKELHGFIMWKFHYEVLFCTISAKMALNITH
eukprot:767680-Hanusia_phi.AAC.2